MFEMCCLSCCCPSSIEHSRQHHSYLLLCSQHKPLANYYMVVVPLWEALCAQPEDFWWFYSISAFLVMCPKSPYAIAKTHSQCVAPISIAFRYTNLGDSNLPGDGMTTLDFIVNKLKGDKAKGPVTLLFQLSVVYISPQLLLLV